MSRWIALSLIALLALLELVFGAAALAQTLTSPPSSPTPPAPTTPAPSPTASAYDRLSPGNQKIARALFEAQTKEAATGTGTATSTAPKPLTLDEIAAQKQSGQGWGRIFKSMKAQGLVEQKNLGQVVSRYSRQQNGSLTTASGRTEKGGRKSWKDADGDGGATTAGSKGHGYKGDHGRGFGGGQAGGGSHGGGGSHARSGGGGGGGRGK